MNGRDVATRMRAIEDNITGETGEDAPPLDRVVSVLLDVDYDGLEDVIVEECRRVSDLIHGWYAHRGVAASPHTVAGLGFVQGVTFAVAAGRLREATYRDALANIATRPTVERNPDGVDQAAWTMQLIAREALGLSAAE